ncbi:uncharacterized protein LOC133387689 isoform X2 [Rhineura floridana]|uniref:uncharacterized protein LOC133387689 isoform X2 n=1 Tax=Rhineura floridana TaxID=261503 RepID=UPI002AC80131|nr:uncharacterized protein LOC133387689 isoform X2 [Rhineura floridana]
MDQLDERLAVSLVRARLQRRAALLLYEAPWLRTAFTALRFQSMPSALLDGRYRRIPFHLRCCPCNSARLFAQPSLPPESVYKSRPLPLYLLPRRLLFFLAAPGASLQLISRCLTQTSPIDGARAPSFSSSFSVLASARTISVRLSGLFGILPALKIASIMEGPLSKWTNLMKGWQYRWFVLDYNAGLLSYYTVCIEGGTAPASARTISVRLSGLFGILPALKIASIMEGPLSKWTNLMKGWQYRWFVLDYNAGLLSYYTVCIEGGTAPASARTISVRLSGLFGILPALKIASIMEGPLSKWTNLMKGWQYRWFVLDYNAGLLSYYTRHG